MEMERMEMEMWKEVSEERAMLDYGAVTGCWGKRREDPRRRMEGAKSEPFT